MSKRKPDPASPWVANAPEETPGERMTRLIDNAAMIILLLGATALLVWLNLSVWASMPGAGRSSPPSTHSQHVTACQRYVLETLRDPNSVEWVLPGNWRYFRENGDRYIRAIYRAQNGFGGMNAGATDCRVD